MGSHHGCKGDHPVSKSSAMLPMILLYMGTMSCVRRTAGPYATFCKGSQSTMKLNDPEAPFEKLAIVSLWFRGQSANLKALYLVLFTLTN